MFYQKILKTLCFWMGLLSSLQADSLFQYVMVHMEKNPQVVCRYLSNLEKSDDNDVLIEVANFYLHDTPMQNINKANVLFKRVAERNDPRGYKGLADSYLSGQGFAQNIRLAHIFYEKAARLGYGPGQFNVAILYRDGVGGERSVQKACFWLKKASQNQIFILQDDARQIAHKLNCVGIKS